MVQGCFFLFLSVMTPHWTCFGEMVLMISLSMLLGEVLWKFVPELPLLPLLVWGTGSDIFNTVWFKLTKSG